MTELRFSKPVVLVGAGPVSQDDFDCAAVHGSRTIAVDGGYDHLAGLGVTPEAVLGDMDSIRSRVPDTVTTLAFAEQDSTDLEKALRTIDAPLIVGIGFLDGRLDHTLAAMHALVAADEARVILLGGEDVVFAAPTEWRAELSPGVRVSFFPMRRVPAVGSKGLRWPLDNLLLEAGGQVGVSNEAVSTNVAAWFAERGVVTILPHDWLAAAVASLT